MFGKPKSQPIIYAYSTLAVSRPINRDFTTTHKELRDEMVAFTDRVMAAGGSITWTMSFPAEEVTP